MPEVLDFLKRRGTPFVRRSRLPAMPGLAVHTSLAVFFPALLRVAVHHPLGENESRIKKTAPL